MVDLVLKNSQLLTECGAVQIVNIGITNGKIATISQKTIEGKQIFDCQAKVVTPSFVNGHAHTAMTLFKGMAEDVSIKDWFNQYIWPYEQQLTHEDVYHAAKVGFAQMIKDGITVVADHYMMPCAVIQAALEVGIRLDMAPTLFSLNHFDQQLDQTIKLARQYQNHSHISISYGPHSLYTVNEQDLLKIVKAQKECPLKIHLHLSETFEQVQEHFRRTGEKPGETFKRLGLHQFKTLIAHGLGLSEAEQDGLKQAALVFCPKTYLKLNMPIEACYHKILPYFFGTDGPASNNTVSVTEQASLFALFGKWFLKDETKYKLDEVYQTILKGHPWFDFGTGKIEEGYAADLIVWDFSKTQSVHPYASMIHEPSALAIDRVMCHGQWLSVDVKKSEVYLARRQKELLATQKHPSPLVF